MSMITSIIRLPSDELGHFSLIIPIHWLSSRVDSSDPLTAHDTNKNSLLRSIVVAVLSASIWTLLRYRRKLHGVPSLSQLRGPRSQSWLKGNHSQLFSLKHGWKFHEMLADECKREQFYTFDPKAMHHILVKDAALFQPHRIQHGALLLGKGLLNVTGEHHRKQRKMLNPVFSIAHMRSMMPIFHDVEDQLRNAMFQRVQDGPREIDLLGWMARTALELIGQSGFGYSFDNMVDDVPRHKYSIVIKDLVPALSRLGFARTYLLPVALKILPTNVRTFIMNVTPWKTLHDVRDMVNYMHELSVEIYEEKKRALKEGDEAVVKQIGKGKDILSILMKENMRADTEDKLGEAEIIAQCDLNVTIHFCFNLLIHQKSGMARILHLLALHPEVQLKMREEIVAARKKREGGSHLSYDELVGLPYLDAVCRETLRLYVSIAWISRTMEDAIVPLSRSVRGTDGYEMTEILLPKATTVMISILNANRDPELWGPDVLEWKPERWLSPLPESIMNSGMPGVYSHLMTFSGGSRACIGFKFSQLEMKVVIATLVENFKFSPPQDKEIFWQMSGLASPIVDGDSRHPQLPLIVELLSCD
ncbi:cytochrome P450 [Lentinula aciculospora]|uniref:Cytochrome P450 n=1 Tax=Lentinula aciculospora TaxID=153920 RepID=A0A9W9AEA1_9AGAR|nr:cytochrome P450 [Lentinula aciculospora]